MAPQLTQRRSLHYLIQAAGQRVPVAVVVLLGHGRNVIITAFAPPEGTTKLFCPFRLAAIAVIVGLIDAPKREPARCAGKPQRGQKHVQLGEAVGMVGENRHRGQVL
jgi:hypothetical protein